MQIVVETEPEMQLGCFHQKIKFFLTEATCIHRLHERFEIQKQIFSLKLVYKTSSLNGDQ